MRQAIKFIKKKPVKKQVKALIIKKTLKAHKKMKSMFHRIPFMSSMITTVMTTVNIIKTVIVEEVHVHFLKVKAKVVKRKAIKILKKAKKMHKGVKKAKIMVQKAKNIVKHLVIKSHKIIKHAAKVVKRVAKKIHVIVHVNHSHCNCAPKKNKKIIINHKVVKYAMKPFKICHIVMKKIKVGSKVWKAHKWIKKTAIHKIKNAMKKNNKAEKFAKKHTKKLGKSHHKKGKKNLLKKGKKYSHKKVAMKIRKLVLNKPVWFIKSLSLRKFLLRRLLL